MKLLDIGSGNKSHRGYETIEIQEKFHPNYLGDFRTMSFTDVDIIRSHHLLEHFGRDESLRVLNLWHDWLKLGGLLIIETPDFEGICKAFIENKDPLRKYWLVRHTYGSQEAEWAFHRNAFWEDSFKKILPDLGFEIIDFTQSISREYLPNITVTAKKLK